MMSINDQIMSSATNADSHSLPEHPHQQQSQHVAHSSDQQSTDTSLNEGTTNEDYRPSTSGSNSSQDSNPYVESDTCFNTDPTSIQAPRLASTTGHPQSFQASSSSSSLSVQLQGHLIADGHSADYSSGDSNSVPESAGIDQSPQGANGNSPSSAAVLESAPSGTGFMVRTRLDEAHDFMVEVSWTELVRLLVDPSTSMSLGDAHLIAKIANFVRGELGQSTLSSPFAFHPPTPMSQSFYPNGESGSAVSSVASDMELLAVHPYDIYPGNGSSNSHSQHSSSYDGQSVHRSIYAHGTSAGVPYPSSHYDQNGLMPDGSWSNKQWNSANGYPNDHPTGHNTSGTMSRSSSTGLYDNHYGGTQTSSPSSIGDSPTMPNHNRPVSRSRHSSDASSLQRAVFRIQASRPYSRSGLPTSVASSGQSIRSNKSDSKATDGSSGSGEASRTLKPLNGRTELYVFDEMSQTVARVSPGMEGLTGDAPVIEFPPGSYYRVFHEELEVLPSDIGHGRAVLWLRGQSCVAKCRFRLEGKRPAVIRAHFATCKLRENLSIDPLGRLCRLQVEARRWATERDRERLASGQASIRSLTDSSTCDSDDSRSIRSEYSIQSATSSVRSFASLPHQQISGAVRPIRSRQYGDGQPLVSSGLARKQISATHPMVTDTNGNEDGACALVSPTSVGVVANGGHTWNDHQWINKVASTDTLQGNISQNSKTISHRAGTHRSTRASIAASMGGNASGASFLSIE